MSQDTSDRIIGELKEFKRQADRRFDRIEAQLEPLKAFKWKVVGASGFMAAIITIGIEYIRSHG